MRDALIDNDVVLKTCCYEVDSAFASVLKQIDLRPTILPLARYVVAAHIRRKKAIPRRDGALNALARILGVFNVVEPNEIELRQAAVFESVAQACNLELDAGESQLLAILLMRGSPLMITGDKRAIRAIEEIAGSEFKQPAIACLEQLAAALVRQIGIDSLRNSICSNVGIDKALSICFSCHSPDTNSSSIQDGLCSYIAAIRRTAQRVLITCDDLSDFVP